MVKLKLWELYKLVIRITFFLLTGCLWSFAAGNGSAGTISGTVTDPTGAVIVGAKVTLSAGSNFRASLNTDGAGQFRFSQVPMGKFLLVVSAQGFKASEFTGELTAPVLIHDVHFQSVTEVQQVEVHGSEDDFLPGPSSSHYGLDAEKLEKTPMAPPQHVMSAVLETVPGSVPEENGRIHIRGSEVQPQYVLDGVPIADNLSGTYGTELDIENMRSTQILTGNIPAEFGDKTAAVVSVNTKSGLEAPWRGSVAFSAGSLNSQAVDGEAGGRFKRLGVFLTLDGSRSQRFLDPPEISNFHNHGRVVHTFARFDLPAGRADVLRLSLSANGSDFQVPNQLDQQLQNQQQRQELRDDFEALNWNHTFNPKSAVDVSLFRRSSSARLLDPDQTGAPFFLEQSRRLTGEGLKASFSMGTGNNLLKAGVEAYRSQIHENFALAVTDPGEVSPEDPVSAFTLQQPFLFNARKRGVRAAGFVQDHVRFGENFTLDVGLRLDHYALLIEQTALSPRVGAAYRFKRSNTVLRASYNRFFQMPPFENLLLSSSPQAAMLSSSGSLFSPVPAEHQNMYEFGVEQPLGSHVRMGVTRYIKNSRNFSDDQQLFTTTVVFPVAIAGADVRGTEIRADLLPWRGWSGSFSYANARATASGPLIGGLFLGNEDSKLTGLGGKFAADQDERNEAQLSATYNHHSGAWVNFTARYDSGIPTEFEAGDFFSFDPRIQQQLDPARFRLKPRTLINSSVGLELMRETRFPISLQLGVNNLTNHFYLYNFQSVFSGTHVGRPREIGARIVFHWTR